MCALYYYSFYYNFYLFVTNCFKKCQSKYGNESYWIISIGFIFVSLGLNYYLFWGAIQLFFVHASAKHDGVGVLSQTLDNIYRNSSCLKLTNRLSTVSGERNKKLIEYRAWQLRKGKIQ